MKYIIHACFNRVVRIVPGMILLDASLSIVTKPFAEGVVVTVVEQVYVA